MRLCLRSSLVTDRCQPHHLWSQSNSLFQNWKGDDDDGDDGDNNDGDCDDDGCDDCDNNGDDDDDNSGGVLFFVYMTSFLCLPEFYFVIVI